MSTEMCYAVDHVFKLWNTGNLSIADEIFSPGYINHDPGNPDINDLSMYKRFVADTRAGMPDFHVEEQDTIYGPDRGAGRWIASGTHTGELMGMPPTGKRAVWEGVTIYRFAEGKIVEGWWFRDNLGMLQQLGIIPQMQSRQSAVA